jgi:tRNA 5-methylaminomethyl-2-thiouridine biosynthesis bifunctional protein
MPISPKKLAASFMPEPPMVSMIEPGKPRSERFDDIYSSSDDPMGESEHVFIAGNRLQHRWQVSPDYPRQFLIAELGFGTGLNFLLTARCWQQLKHRHPDWRHLHYVGYERFPIDKTALEEIHSAWRTSRSIICADFDSLSGQLLANWRFLLQGIHRIRLTQDITLDLVIGDAENYLAQRSPNSPAIDAWYLDGFSPRVNPELWQESLLKQLATHSDKHTSLATYSSAGRVRRGLQAAGFEVSRSDGWQHKRHMLTATYPESPNCSQRQREPQSALIVGAGLAGCFTANALSARGFRVTLIDGGVDFGAGASGIPQLSLRLRLFNEANSMAQFFLQSYLFSLRQLIQLQQDLNFEWHACGIRQLTSAMNRRKPLNFEKLAHIYGDEVFSPEQEHSLWFHHGGWINPIQLCRALTANAGNSPKFNSPIQRIEYDGANWRCLDHKDKLLGIAENLVLASPQLVDQLSLVNAAKLEFTVGTSSRISAIPGVKLNRHVETGLRSVFPEQKQTQLISATYARSRLNRASVAEASVENITALRTMLNLPKNSSIECLENFERERANPPDRLPMIGQLSEAALPEEYRRGCDHLYVNTGHGSSGLATCPLAGEIVAAQITGEDLPATSEQLELISPARFWQRQRRGQKK